MSKKQAVWETKKYYREAHQASLDLSHPGLQIIEEEARKANKILEIGCGEGTKLANLTSKVNETYGVDISKTAICLARRQYPRIHFQVVDAEQLPFPKNSFDLVFTAFVMEHSLNPEKIISEMIRVLRRNGRLIILAPNYGAPNRASPCFTGSRIKKFIRGMVQDLYSLVIPAKKLSWLKVIPKATEKDYEIDEDTTVEPYLNSLRLFLQIQGLTLKKVTSFWQEIKENRSILQQFFAFLGKLKIYPFIYWGPHLLIVAQKKQ